MRIKRLLYSSLLAMTLTCCQPPKEQNLKEWNALVERIEVNEDLTEEELEAISAEYDRLSRETPKHMDDFTPEEKQELGRLQARYLKGYAKHTTNELIEGFKGLIDVAGGFLKELSTSIDTSKIKAGAKQLMESIDTTALNNMARNIGNNLNKEKLQEIANSVDKQEMEKIATGLGALGAELCGVVKENIDVEQLRKSMTEEDVRRIANSLTKEDIDALKKSITKDDVKKLKESLSKEEIQKLKSIYKELNKE